MSPDGTVLVVDDDPSIADAFASYLEGEYAVRTAYGGPEALEALDDSIDVVLLDRRMPGLTGDDVLARIRERDISCRVAMVTAVDPDFDIVDMPFDDYLVKPVSAEELLETIDRLLTLDSFRDTLQTHYSLASKRALLRTTKAEEDLERSEDFRELNDRIDSLETEVEDVLDELPPELAFETIGAEGADS